MAASILADVSSWDSTSDASPLFSFPANLLKVMFLSLNILSASFLSSTCLASGVGDSEGDKRLYDEERDLFLPILIILGLSSFAMGSAASAFRLVMSER